MKKNIFSVPGKWMKFLLPVFAGTGLADSFLIFEKTRNVISPPCLIFDGCETVIFSPYAKFLGISLSIWGMAFYGAMLVLAIILFFYPKRNILHWALIFSGAGFLFSLCLLFLQLFVIKALCSYCVVSLVASGGIFAVLAVRFFRERKSLKELLP